jgi:lipoate-protein ligase A
MLWINSPCIVVGRNQNAWHECDLGEMYTRGVKLARRLSGGGTVFHDLHNLNITFLSSRDAFSKESNSELLVRALNSAGAPTAAPTVSTNERTDLIVNGRKVSGSAYRLNGTTAYHHCTLLVGTDLTTLSNVLRPSLPSIVTKGIPSVRSPVCNLAEVGHLADMASILTLVETAYLDHHGTLAAAGHAAVLSATGLAEKSELLAARCRELQQWEWLCGTGPPFHVTFPLDDALGSTLTLHVKQGNVIRAEVQGRSSNDDEVVGDMLTATLAGTPFYGTHLLAALHNADTTTLSPATVAAAMDALGTVKFWNEIS